MNFVKTIKNKIKQSYLTINKFECKFISYKYKQQIYSQILQLKQKMSTDFHTKPHYPTTSHKSDFSFSSPQQQPTIAKKVLMESQVDVRNRRQLFSSLNFDNNSNTSTKQREREREMKENINLLSMVGKSYSKEFVQQMRNQQRIQVEKLLLQISRLHDLLEDQQRMHRHGIQRLKEESEQIALLRISSLKQSQFSQIQAIENQLKKTRQALEEKTLILEQIQRNSARQIQSLTNQNQNLKADLKQLVQKKNVEIYQLKTQLSKENQDSTRRKEEQLQQLKNLADKQLKKVLRKLEQKQKSIESLNKQFQNTTQQNKNLQQLFEKQKLQLSEKLEKTIQIQRQRQNEITQNLKKFYEQESDQFSQDLKNQRQLFLFQIQQLQKIIKIKDNEQQRNLIFRQAQRLDFKLQSQANDQLLQSLKSTLSSLSTRHAQQLELLKSKMSILHETDLSSVVRLYQSKLQSLSKQLQLALKQSQLATQQAKKLHQSQYQMKKKYDYTVSFLHEQLNEIKYGYGNTERDMKQKLENQKSMMMLTSRNFIKENQMKNNNIRFYQEELRKLRQLLEIQAQEVEESERNVEEKIKLAEDELGRLSNKIIEVKSQAEENQRRLKAIIEEKNAEIKKLNQILNDSKVMHHEDDHLRNQIKRLDEQSAKKQDELRSLRVRCQQTQAQIRLLKSDNERLSLQAQINSQDAKKQYKSISDKNFADMKSFFQRRLQQLEHDKKQLQKINSSQSQQITELIKRYKILEEGMKAMLKQVKKRSELDMRVIELGMDTNLVKNMGEIFHR